jgi:hypothetical protein
MDFLLLGCKYFSILTNFYILGDGIFDKIGNAEIMKQSWIAAKKNYKTKD